MPGSERLRGRVALRLALFLLPVLVGWGVLEWWLAKVPTIHSLKHHQLDLLADRIDTLILGSSGSLWDISPQYLSGSAYNLGSVAQTLYYDEQLAALVVPKLPKLRRVILTVPYVGMFYQLHGTDEEERQYYYYQEWGIPPPRTRERFDPRMWSAVALRTPATAINTLSKALIGLARGRSLEVPPVDPPVDERGWQPREPGDPADLEPPAVDNKIAYHHGLMHLSEEPANRASLSHLIAQLRARGIEVILVTTPVWKTYSARMRQDYWERAQADIQQLSSTYQVRYLSFLNTPQLGPADFLDADHLNQHGAVIFTKLLSAAIGPPPP